MEATSAKVERDTGRSRATPTVSRVLADGLIELTYDPERQETALLKSQIDGSSASHKRIALPSGETLAPYAAKNNLIATGCVLLPSEATTSGGKASLVDDIGSYLDRYVDLSPGFRTVAVYYVLLSWVHDAFGELPYLRLRGDYGTGKTRGLIAIGSICYKPFFASAASSVSAIFRTLDAFGGTLLFDEADLPFSDARADMVKIFNNGTVRGIPVLRAVQNANREFDPQAFRVFGPKLIAMRGSFDDPALESRFITEQTGERPLRPDIPIHLPASLKADALALRNRLLQFRFVQFFAIRTDPAALIEGVEPRLNQTALSLLSLIDEPAQRIEVRDLLLAQHAQLMADRSDTTEAAVLLAIRTIQIDTNDKPVTVRAVTDQFNRSCAGEYGMVSPKWIGHIMRKRLHLSTTKSSGIYILSPLQNEKINTLAQRFGLLNEA